MNKQPVVFILLGQSNAVGHSLPMAAEDRIDRPLPNVYGLARAENQSFDISALTWEHYVSGGMNLAEEQDHTYSVANCLAAAWQRRIDGGEALPDLYIVHIAIGAQGVTGEYMWNPAYERVLVPGKLKTVRISLHAFTLHILGLVRRYMTEKGLNPRYILHWRGGEEDMLVPVATLREVLQPIYTEMLQDYRGAVGVEPETTLHRIICEAHAANVPNRGNCSESLHHINGVFEALAAEHDGISVFDPRTCPYYDPSAPHCGVFKADNVHYTREMNEWVAEKIIGDATVSDLLLECK